LVEAALTDGDLDGQPLRNDGVGFGVQRPLILEIGFGRGAFLLHLARRYPDHNIVGLEISNRCMVIGEKLIAREQLTNVRASGTDEAVRLVPPVQLSLEAAVEFIDEDELVELTPKSIRLRKRYLTEIERKRAVRGL
jgi:GTP-binding protein